MPLQLRFSKISILKCKKADLVGFFDRDIMFLHANMKLSKEIRIVEFSIKKSKNLFRAKKFRIR